MKNTIFFSFILLFSAGLPAQTLERQLVSAAGYHTAPLHASVGEIAVRPAGAGSTVTWNEGFQQTASPAATPVAETPDPAANAVRVWPNPTNAVVNVQADVPVSLAWFDLTGRQLGAQAAAGAQATVDLGLYPAGIYLLRLSAANGRVLKTVRIVRQ